MNYSKTHKNFSTHLENHEALTNPQDFLGPNYETVLNFWWHLEILTKEQLELSDIRYYDYKLRLQRYDIIRKYAYNMCESNYLDCAIEATREISRGIKRDYCYIAAPVTYELITLQTILDAGEDLIFVPMLSNL
jgi:hypothetical protein